MTTLVMIALALSGAAMAQPGNVRFTCTDTGSPVRGEYFYVQDVQTNWATTTLLTDDGGHVVYTISHAGDYVLTCKGVKKQIKVLSGQMAMQDNPTLKQQLFTRLWENKKYI